MSGGVDRHGLLPSGTVTFLFTDVEGSTRLWAAAPDAMAASLRLHDEVLRDAVESRGGFVFTTAGDSFAVAFARASVAVDAAIAAQQALAGARWPGPRLRVRMGLHLGEVEERGGDYFGPAVNTCARVEGAGHGGQVLVTEAVRSVVDRTDLVDLGPQLLRDVPDPIRLFQVGDGTFPPLRGLVGARDTLPVRRTRLLGRDPELLTLAEHLVTERLVTLVGPGGIGKTSLAIEAAGRVSAEFPGGAHFVDLAQISDPDEIVSSMCRGVQLAVTGVPYEHLCRYLASAAALVVVDNCEHLIDDVAEVIDRLLEDVPSVHLLATSREHLDLDGERVVRVGPLPSDVGSAAVRLFVERVVAQSPSFDPDATQLDQIASICRRLDGLPLAIELAAGRARSLSLDEIERGLDDRFTLLAGARRGKLRRQQTLWAAIDWSIDLLDPTERDLLARLAVFAGPFSVTGAAEVSASPASAIADHLGALTGKSLVDRVGDIGGEARFRMLETVREWGLEELARAGRLREVRDLHASWHLSTAEAKDTNRWLADSADDSGGPDTADAAAAAIHLREHDAEGAALILAARMNQIVENGFGGLGRDLQRAARAAGWTRSPCRQFLADHALQMSMMESLPYDEPPPEDDGSFEHRYLVGGPHLDNGGLVGWYRSWIDPAGVVTATRALGPVATDVESRLIRAFALANAVMAFVHLGHFEEAVVAFEESRRLTSALGCRPAGISTENHSVAVAAVILDLDLRGSSIAAEQERWALSNILYTVDRAVVLTAPADRRVALATAARQHCHGRLPGEEALFLVYFGHYALLDGDADRARSLVGSLPVRSPATVSLARHTLLRADGEPLGLIADEGHHLAALARAGEQTDDVDELGAVNRQKLHDEVARILD